MLLALPAFAPWAGAADPTPPFGECPAAGSAPSCNVLIVFNADGTVGIFQGQTTRIDNDEDTLVGVRNSSGHTISNTVLSSNNVNIHPFAFDGDGMCSTSARSQPRPAGCPYQTTGTGADYAGPGITYTAINAAKTSGTVNFAKSCTQTTTCTSTPTGLTDGSTVFFSLEDKVDAGNIVVPGVISSKKTASSATANIGDQITYTIKLSNSGSSAGTTDVIDDYDEAHLTNITAITGGGVNNSPSAGKIKWTAVSVPPGADTVTLSYKGTITGPFSGSHGSCGTGFPVVNTVTLSNGTGTSNTVCVTVNSGPNITSKKTASTSSAAVGDTVTYTIKLSNSGGTAGTTDVVDDYDEDHLTISNISGGGVDNSPTAGKIKWTAVNVPIGPDTVTLTYDATIHGPFSGGSGTCPTGQFPVINTVQLSAGTGTSTKICVTVPVIMTGRAFALSLDGLIPIGPLADTGPIATANDSTTDPNCILPLDTGIVDIDVLCSKVITNKSPVPTSAARASILDVRIALPGVPLIAAGAVIADSKTTCEGSEGTTTIAYLRIGDTVIIPSPSPIDPNTEIAIPGVISVVLNEQLPVAGADQGLTVNAIHIKVLDGAVADLILSSATSDIHGC